MKNSWMKIMAMGLVTIFVAASCTTVRDEKTPEAMMDKSEATVSADTMATADVMATADTMVTADVMETTDTMEKEDAMTTEIGHTTDDDMSADVVMMTNDGALSPNFEFMDIKGEVHKLSDYEGQKVYVKYWASWCSICLAGLEELDKLSATTDDFVVLTVVTPGAYGEQSKEDFIQWFNGLPYKNIQVLFDENGKIAKELGVRAFPTSVFIGSDGVLIQAAPGHKSNEQINQSVGTYY